MTCRVIAWAILVSLRAITSRVPVSASRYAVPGLPRWPAFWDTVARISELLRNPPAIILLINFRIERGSENPSRVPSSSSRMVGSSPSIVTDQPSTTRVIATLCADACLLSLLIGWQILHASGEWKRHGFRCNRKRSSRHVAPRASHAGLTVNASAGSIDGQRQPGRAGTLLRRALLLSLIHI